ncbi:hypothetical protein [Marinactinospora rubrisoli]|uniref:Uncharacterized protein n=1 Tax=Marinactinospora rubrisoli TaxID=2715399 RepID=A0ABW2KH63_9ACTN
MSETRPRPTAGDPPPGGRRTVPRINEDWAATITGLALLVLALLGAIPAWLVP